MRFSFVLNARLAATMAALLLAACGDANTARPTAPSPPDVSPFARSSRGQARLASLFDGASAEVLGVGGSVFADHDEPLGRLVFGIERLSAATAVHAAAARAGLATAEYTIVVAAPIHTTASLSDAFLVSQGGLQVGTAKLQCTLGFNVAHAAGRSFITNSHCTDRQGGPEKTQFWQPQVGVGMLIGVEAADPVYTSNKACPKERRCRYSDAARIAYSPSARSNQGFIASTGVPNTGSTTVTGSLVFTQQDDLTREFPVGQTIHKIGATTGWTSGQVSRSCVHANVVNSPITLLCQTFVRSTGVIVDAGDSGAPAFLQSGDDNILFGIVWGRTDFGEFVFSPLEGIVRDLGRMSAIVGGPVSNSIGNGK